MSDKKYLSLQHPDDLNNKLEIENTNPKNTYNIHKRTLAIPQWTPFNSNNEIPTIDNSPIYDEEDIINKPRKKSKKKQTSKYSDDNSNKPSKKSLIKQCCDFIFRQR